MPENKTPQQWHIADNNPIIVPGQLHGSLDARRAGAAHVTRCGHKYRMVYWGSDGDGRHQILSAQANVATPEVWTPSKPFIRAQPETMHNCTGPGFPFLLPVTENYWLLYFCGWGDPSQRRLPNTTGVAVTHDAGESWHYHETNPILPLDRLYDQGGTGSVWVLHENGKFRMYYTAIGRYFDKPANVQSGHGEVIPEIGIAYAESDDGIHWRKPFDDWIVRPRHFGVEPYEYICSKPCVVRTKSGYIMWVNTFGTAYRVHRLTSHDGIDWQWAPRVGGDGELGVGEEGAFDSIQRCYPTVVEHEGEFRCWFTGNGFGATGMGYASVSV